MQIKHGKTTVRFTKAEQRKLAEVYAMLRELGQYDNEASSASDKLASVCSKLGVSMEVKDDANDA
jgi:hypothetical protein